MTEPSRSRSPVAPASLNAREHMSLALGFTPSEPQWAALSAPLRPASIVAGAGSGKTAVMSARVVWAVMTGQLRADEILGLTFTNKAAAELAERIRGYLSTANKEGVLDAAGAGPDPGFVDAVSVSTYHAFASRIIAEYGVRLGIESKSVVLSDIDRYQLASRVVATTTADLGSFAVGPDTMVDRVIDLDGALAELDVSTELLRSDASALLGQLQALNDIKRLQSIGQQMIERTGQRIILADVVDEFRQAKFHRNVVDFADQLRLSLSLVRQFPVVAQTLRSTYGLVLLDEYQDTSIAQRLLLQELFAHGHPVTAVGDPCQAIYGWRGASVDNIDRFAEHFPQVSEAQEKRPADTYPLTDNRRSAAAILDLANSLAEPLRSIHRGVGPLTCAAEDVGPGFVRAGFWNTQDDEDAWVAQEIASYSGPWRDVLVLARTADHLACIDQMLTAGGVPTQIVGARTLIGHPLVQQVLAYLHVVVDPTANAAFTRIATGPRWRIGLRDMAALGGIARHLATQPRAAVQHTPDLSERLAASVYGQDAHERLSLSDACIQVADGLDDPVAQSLSAQARERLGALAREIKYLRNHHAEAPRDLLQRVLTRTGLGTEALIGSLSVVAENTRAVYTLMELAGGFSDLDGRVSVPAFLAYTETAYRREGGPDLDSDSGDDVVRLMTVHGAKGLEAPHVFIAGLRAAEFPSGKHRQTWPTTAEVVPWGLRPDAPLELRDFPRLCLEPRQEPRKKDHDDFIAASHAHDEIEERRLLYVGVTRAQRSVTLTGSGWSATAKEYRGPGPYLMEVRDWCIGAGHEIVAWAQPPADGAVNPIQQAARAGVPWLMSSPQHRAHQVAADAVREQLAQTRAAALTDEAQRLLAQLTDGGRSTLSALPAQVSVTELNRFTRNPQDTLAQLDRPMPSAPSAAAHRGSRIHAMIEQHYRSTRLFDVDDLPGAADEGIDEAWDLAAIQQALADTEFAHSAPIAVEQPFVLMWQGRQVKGRIDAVFRRGDRDVVVDWKTGHVGSADPAQLEIYRLAWASLTGVEVGQVDAEFVYL